MRTVFLNAAADVVTIIVGEIAEENRAQFLSDYRPLFGAETLLIVDESVAVGIGDHYDASTGAFAPPPPPEVIEGTSEIIG